MTLMARLFGKNGQNSAEVEQPQIWQWMFLLEELKE